ncbi:MAG: SDR family oxidoreductase [Cyanobacteria bacterium P01_E01_bin.42]
MPTALITGATSGIGKAFADRLAEKSFNLVLLARNEIRLEKIARELRQKKGIQVKTIPFDLTESDAGKRVFETMQTDNTTVDWLVNNAGVGDYGVFEASDRDRQLDIVRLNILALTDLTHCFLPPMLEQRSGVIINVGSIASFQPMPYWATYGASKAFVLSFSEALRAEVRDRGVKVLALCPGPTQTAFFDRANFPQQTQSTGLSLADPDTVVQQAIEAIEADKQTIVGGASLLNFVVNLQRFLPREWMIELLKQQFQPNR